MANEMLFEDLPIGAKFDDGCGNTFIKTEEMKIEIDHRLFRRNAVVIQSSSQQCSLGYSGFFGGCQSPLKNIVLPE